MPSGELHGPVTTILRNRSVRLVQCPGQEHRAIGRRGRRVLYETLLGLVSDFDQFGVKLDILEGDLAPPRIVLSLMVVSQMREVE